MFLKFIFILLLSLISSPVSAHTSYQVVKVIDGDTFEATDGTIRFRVRIAGIDTPERGQPYYKLARLRLKDMIGAKKITIHPVGRGLERYNRVLGHVKLNGQDVGERLIESGLAYYYRPRCRDWPADKDKYNYDPRPYVRAERKARGTGDYIWSKLSSTMPCRWRKEQRARRQK